MEIILFLNLFSLSENYSSLIDELTRILTLGFFTSGTLHGQTEEAYTSLSVLCNLWESATFDSKTKQWSF
jgi:hypothetical protein